MADKKAKADEPKQEPKAEQTPLEQLQGKTIDERMAMLERDLKRMGAR